MKNETEQNISSNKPSKWKYIIITAVFVFLVTVAFFYMYIKSVPDPASETIIRWAAADTLTEDANNPIDPNTLTDEDFAQMTELRIDGRARIRYPVNIANISDYMKLKKFTIISDLSMLEKFTNLQKIQLYLVSYPKENIPEWMKIFGRLGIINLEDRIYLNLKPLENLTYLRRVNISYSDIKNIEPLASLSNLEFLDLSRTQVSDLKPLMKLRNLKTLILTACPNIKDEQVEELQKALPELKIIK